MLLLLLRCFCRWRARTPYSELQGWKFWTFRFLLLMLAVLADKLKVFPFRFILRDPEALAMLPHVAFFAGDAVGAVIQILPMHSTARAVEDPLIVL